MSWKPSFAGGELPGWKVLAVIVGSDETVNPSEEIPVSTGDEIRAKETGGTVPLVKPSTTTVVIVGMDVVWRMTSLGLLGCAAVCCEEAVA